MKTSGTMMIHFKLHFKYDLQEDNFHTDFSKVIQNILIRKVNIGKLKKAGHVKKVQIDDLGFPEVQ